MLTPAHILLIGVILAALWYFEPFKKRAKPVPVAIVPSPTPLADPQSGSPQSSEYLFFLAHQAARREADAELSVRQSKAQRDQAVSAYQAPFYEPPAPQETPPAPKA